MARPPVTPGIASHDRDFPRGVVTFLFSDIEGSTPLLERHRAVFGSVMVRYHALLDGIVRGRGGVVFETVGDAVYAAFEHPADAMSAAVIIQRGMASEPWGLDEPLRVRIAIHSGPVEVRGSHYFGPALFECARIQALAHGSQTIASSTTAALVGRDLPAGTQLRELGLHRLKGLEDPMGVVQLDGDGLPTTFPPLRTSMRSPTNLPRETSSFVGRTDDLDRLHGSIGQHRLVSLIGAGGTGKTRLAIEAAGRQLDRFRDGVWLVELAPITDQQLVLTQVADTWGLRPGHSAPLEDVLQRFLASRELLLVVDNCEHVIDGAARTIHDILRRAPGVSIVATSRESLGVPGELEYRVSPLSVEAGGADARGADAVRLFLERFHSTQPDADVSDEELEAIMRICRRVEGIPLAIELAAARSRILAPAELAERLESTFEALGTAGKTSEPRQRTLTATLDWSYDLLDLPARRLFRRLAVFAGSFDLDAAQEVCGSAEHDRDLLDVLESLVDRSLVTTVPGLRTRFRLLEPVRQYAHRHLVASDELRAIASAHARHFATFVALAAPRTRGDDQMAWERRIDDEYDDIRLALETLLQHDELEAYLTVAFDLFHYWMHLGMQVEGAAMLAAGLERADASCDTVIRLRAWFTAAMLLAEITDPAGIELAREGVALARSTGEPDLIGRLELALGAAIRHATNDPAYLEHLLEARALLQAHPQPHWWEPAWDRAYTELLLAAYLPPEDAAKERHVRAAIEAYQEIGDRVMEAQALFESATLLGRSDETWLMDNLYRSVEMLDGMQAPYQHGHALMILGIVLGLANDHGAAAPQLAEASDKLSEMGDVSCWAQSSRYLSLSQASLGSPEAGAGPLADVIAALPDLPMPEYDIPRTLDVAVRVLIDLGRWETAAYTLGLARATPFDVATIIPRDTSFEDEQRALLRELGEQELQRWLAEGAAAETDTAFDRISKELRAA